MSKRIWIKISGKNITGSGFWIWIQILDPAPNTDQHQWGNVNKTDLPGGRGHGHFAEMWP